MTSNKSLARVAGLLYLGVAVAGGFAEAVRKSIVVTGDAPATASNVVQHSTLVQVGFGADLADLPLFLAIGVIMYAILKPVSPRIALAMLVINAVSVAIQALNMLNQAGAFLVATDPHYTAGLSAVTSQALVLFFLEMHRVGYLIAQIFFGLFLLPLGYLVYRSGLFPRVLGAILAIGSIGYLTQVAVTFAMPGLDSNAASIFGLAGGLAEMVFLLWLIVKGTSSEVASPAPIKGALSWKA